MKLTLLEEIRPYEFKWPSGTIEPYEVCYAYEITDPPTASGRGRMFVAIGWRIAYGSNRRRILVFRNRQTVLAEFVGTDDWEETRNAVWPLKQAGSNRSVRTDADIPSDYRGFDLSRCSDWITGRWARRGYGIRVREDDHETLIRIALIREQHRKHRSIASGDRTTAVMGKQ